MRKKVSQFIDKSYQREGGDHKYVEKLCTSTIKVWDQARSETVRKPFAKSYTAWRIPKKFGGWTIRNSGSNGSVKVGKGAMLDLRTGDIYTSRVTCKGRR